MPNPLGKKAWHSKPSTKCSSWVVEAIPPHRLHICMHPYVHICICIYHHGFMCNKVENATLVHLLTAPPSLFFYKYRNSGEEGLRAHRHQRVSCNWHKSRMGVPSPALTAEHHSARPVPPNPGRLFMGVNANRNSSSWDGDWLTSNKVGFSLLVPRRFPLENAA